MPAEPIRFTPVQLYENEREDLIKLAHEQYVTLFKNVRFAQANGFASQVRAFSRTTRATVCAETKIHATIPELVDVFLGDRTNAAIGFAQSQQIYRFLAPTGEHPLVAVALAVEAYPATRHRLLGIHGHIHGRTGTSWVGANDAVSGAPELSVA
ncbi:hypothetical protein PI124_g9190 [Phytophthora idaei]|nr:hypothetical protein PI125_g17062 [Phytophthora idaei]KAG3139329.1 hypothetical protein PI126_g16506 [Phytophthora idaei]KAG3246080.1 hypothetical protein PI124_g9190 [Phytophthora idaei]